MNEQIALLVLGSLPALLVLITPFWMMVYFDQRGQQQKKPVAAPTRSRGPVLQALPSRLHQKAEHA